MTAQDARDEDPTRLLLPLPIRTTRLLLRPCREGDGAALAEAVAESFDDLHPWFHDAMLSRHDEGCAIWQEIVACRSLARFKAREQLQFLAWTEAGSLVGSVELGRPDWRRRAFRLAYWMRSSVQRRGYGTEATAAVLHYAFGVLAARRVTVGHAAPNAASARLIQRLGFREFSRMPMGSEMPDGRFVEGVRSVMTDGSALPRLPVSWDQTG